MSKELIYLLSWASPLLLLIGVAVGTIYFKQLDRIRKAIFFYLIGGLLFDLTGRIMGHYFSNNNLILIPLFALFELPLFTYIYILLFNKKYSAIIYTLSGAAFLFMIVESLTVNSSDYLNFQSYSRTVGAFLIVMYSIGYYFKNFFKISADSQRKMTLNTVILSFFSLNLIFLLPINFLINATSHLRFYLWLGNLCITLLFYLFLSISLWRNGKTLKH